MNKIARALMLTVIAGGTVLGASGVANAAPGTIFDIEQSHASCVDMADYYNYGGIRSGSGADGVQAPDDGYFYTCQAAGNGMYKVVRTPA